jgi:hypothetical protein
MTDIEAKMRPEIKERWLAALRSDQYEQGTGRLGMRGTDGQEKFCCLGVLCELARQDGAIKRDELASGNPNVAAYTYSGYSSDLPTAVIRWAWGGLGRKAGTIAQLRDPMIMLQRDGDGERFGAPTRLSGLNDCHRYNFHQIADIIEAQL